jgi:hypothetical protein
MTDRRTAATPWEVEAERRREVIEGDVLAAHRSRREDPAGDMLAVARGRRLLRSVLRGSADEGRPQPGRLNQKRV